MTVSALMLTAVAPRFYGIVGHRIVNFGQYSVMSSNTPFSNAISSQPISSPVMPGSARRPFKRSITSLQLLTQLGIEHGLSVEQCLAGTGLAALQLADTTLEVEPAAELQLIRNLLAALPDEPTLGLQAAQRYQLTTYGIWGYALLSSPTIRSAAELGLRYLDLTFAFAQISLHEDDQQAHIHVDASQVEDDVRAFITQRDTFAVLVIQRELLGQQSMPLQGLTLRLPQPADENPYRQLLGFAPQFGAADNRISFARALLDQPLPRANPATVELCDAQCRALLARRQVRAGIAVQVRHLLLCQPGKLPNMPRVASQLNLSERSLRRQLHGEQTSFRQLLEEVRQALAEELLATGGLSLEDIASRLGYGESSNFIHAFKRWKGLPPSQYLQTLHKV